MKYIFFSVFFFFFTITGRNEAIIVELKTLFVLNSTLMIFSGGSHLTLDFSQLRKMVPALAFNSVIATSA